MFGISKKADAQLQAAFQQQRALSKEVASQLRRTQSDILGGSASEAKPAASRSESSANAATAIFGDVTASLEKAAANIAARRDASLNAMADLPEIGRRHEAVSAEMLETLDEVETSLRANLEPIKTMRAEMAEIYGNDSPLVKDFDKSIGEIEQDLGGVEKERTNIKRKAEAMRADIEDGRAAAEIMSKSMNDAMSAMIDAIAKSYASLSETYANMARHFNF